MIRIVRGHSMEPALRPGDIILTRRRMPALKEIAIAQIGQNEVVKRVVKIEDDKYYLLGDNGFESTDSRHYGFISKTDILGTIMIVLPKSVPPPKLVLPYGLWLGRSVAVILVIMAVIHLFRIDTFIPIIDAIVPGRSNMAIFISLVIILSEVFAVPFALRMKLSPLAHLMSGALVVFAPLWWLLLSVWAYGSGFGTGQLGAFLEVPASGWMITLNLLWLALGYFALYALGYNRLKLAEIVRSHRK